MGAFGEILKAGRCQRDAHDDEMDGTRTALLISELQAHLWNTRLVNVKSCMKLMLVELAAPSSRQGRPTQLLRGAGRVLAGF